MDFPVFHIDFFGDRLLIGFIAVVHVVVSHGFAVGALPLITTMEWWGWRSGDRRWDDLAHRYLWVCFIIATSIGALTGVGIWLSASLVNPYAIGSLIRVFFWAWFLEWIVFVTEVSLILAYFLLWDRWQGERKLAHIRIGVALSVASFLTMAIIVGILGYMMDPGAWRATMTLRSGFFNPIYIPQLVFRAPLAMVMAGVLALFLNLFFTSKGEAFAARATRFVCVWTLVWTPVLAVGCLWYRSVIPGFMAKHFSVALGTMRFDALYSTILTVTTAGVAVIGLAAIVGALRPQWLPRGAWVILMLLALGLIGEFERAREFIRKPYVLAGYMYANGIRVSDYPLLMKEGILANSIYVHKKEITSGNRVRAGKDLFLIACSRCHTVNGVNSIRDKLGNMYGTDAEWDADAIDGYLSRMFATRTFMPPFPGTLEERKALAAYLATLRTRPDIADGAQTAGTAVRRQ